MKIFFIIKKASGNHKCKGHIGILTAKARKKQIQIQVCFIYESSECNKAHTCSDPISEKIHKIAHNKNIDPIKVYIIK